MPNLIRQEQSIKLLENENLAKAAEELGIPFSCHTGICGMCSINIRKGEENLSSLTENEEDLGMCKGMRLACQCKIKSGNVEIE